MAIQRINGGRGRPRVARSKPNALAAFLFAGCGLAVQTAYGASAQVHGQGAVVGDYFVNIPPTKASYQGFRVPLGLMLEGRASNNLSLFLDVRFGFNQYPNLANNLGNTTDTQRNPGETPNGPPPGPNTGNEVRQPFTVFGGRGEKSDELRVTSAFIQYASDVGLFRAGRMPRHWGLGLWRNAQWLPEGGTISTSDAISATFDLTSSFSGSLYYEKNSEGQPGSIDDDAGALTVEALLADDPSDVGSSTVTRQIGVAFSRYTHGQSDTELSILDLFAKIYVNAFVVEGELLYPSGDTKSLDYAQLGGRSIKCPASQNRENFDISCASQTVEGFAALLKMRYQVGGTAAGPEKTLNIAATEAQRLRQPTSLLADSHTLGLWAGYASGDKDGFAGVGVSPAGTDRTDGRITSIPMHPNIRPALLMYNTVLPPTPGMPGAQVLNSWFVRGEYIFESPGFGQLVPAVIYGSLDRTNTKLTDTRANPDTALGRDKSLGFELDLAYAYKTVDNLKLGVEAGLWIPGKAWDSKAGDKPPVNYGLRTTASTSF